MNVIIKTNKIILYSYLEHIHENIGFVSGHYTAYMSNICSLLKNHSPLLCAYHTVFCRAHKQMLNTAADSLYVWHTCIELSCKAKKGF